MARVGFSEGVHKCDRRGGVSVADVDHECGTATAEITLYTKSIEVLCAVRSLE